MWIYVNFFATRNTTVSVLILKERRVNWTIQLIEIMIWTLWTNRITSIVGQKWVKYLERLFVQSNLS